MLSRGGNTLEVFNDTVAALPYKAVVSLLPMDKSYTAVGKRAYRAQTWVVGSDIGSLGLLAVVTSAQGIGVNEYGSVALAGGLVEAKIDGNATSVSQYDVLVGVTGKQYFRKWGSAQMVQSASTVSYNASTVAYSAVSVAAGGLSGSDPGTGLTATTISRLQQNTNSLRLELNKLIRDVKVRLDAEYDNLRNDVQTQLDGEYDALRNSVDSVFEVVQSVRAIYVGTVTLTTSDATGQVLLMAGPLGAQG